MLGIQEMTGFGYLRNKSVWTLSQNLQISPNCIIQADSKVLELQVAQIWQRDRASSINDFRWGSI